MNPWIKELLKSLDKNLDEKTKMIILEACGVNCPFTHLTDQRLLDIKKESINEHDFLEKLSQQWRVRIEDNDIYVIFDKCYCPLINQDIKDSSKTLCYRTLGNIKKKFRLGFAKDVNVIMEKTILAGDTDGSPAKEYAVTSWMTKRRLFRQFRTVLLRLIRAFAQYQGGSPLFSKI